MKTYFKLFLSGGLIALAVSSCYNDNKEDIYQNNPDGNNCDTSAVSYNDDISLIFQNSCTSSGCHAGTSPAANLDLTDYNQVKNSASKIVDRINGNGALMPQGGPALSDCKILQIETWVADGAPNN